jgi:hypothetical protein
MLRPTSANVDGARRARFSMPSMVKASLFEIAGCET